MSSKTPLPAVGEVRVHPEHGRVLCEAISYGVIAKWLDKPIGIACPIDFRTWQLWPLAPSKKVSSQ